MATKVHLQDYRSITFFLTFDQDNPQVAMVLSLMATKVCLGSTLYNLFAYPQPGQSAGGNAAQANGDKGLI
jgi:hypothetical protein